MNEIIEINGNYIHTHKVLHFVNKKRKIRAIKYVIKETGLDLKSAKELVENIIHKEKNKKAVTDKKSLLFLKKDTSGRIKIQWILFVIATGVLLFYFLVNKE